jgi:Peptidase family M3
VHRDVSAQFPCAQWANKGEEVRLPCAHMVCNQTPPIGDAPSLMTFREVETLFHEFGHALQHMLTKEREGLVSGIRGIEWDAVELPSARPLSPPVQVFCVTQALAHCKSIGCCGLGCPCAELCWRSHIVWR